MQDEKDRAEGLLVTVEPGPGPMRGRIVRPSARKQIGYRGEWELLFGIDQWCDGSGVAPPTLRLRSFSRRCRRKTVRKAVFCLDPKPGKNKEEKASFLVQIRFRQNATWQGSITWLETDKKQEFRSAFEMLKLMEEARCPGVQERICWDPEKGK